LPTPSSSGCYKIEPFDGNTFKRWQQKVLSVFDFTKISSSLTEPRPYEESEEQSEELRNWEMANKLCVNTILNALSNKLSIATLLLLKIYGMN
jgi:hypothetical protein